MSGLAGGISSVIFDPKIIKVDSVAMFAVDEHNKKENAQLEFVRVVKEEQSYVIAAGSRQFLLTLDVIDAGKKKTYEAKVWEKIKEFKEFKELKEFKLVADSTDVAAKPYRHLGVLGALSVPRPSPVVEVADLHSLYSLQNRKLAMFAVDEHNKKENAKLLFGRLVKLVEEEQAVADSHQYLLTLEAIDGHMQNTYEAKVLVKPLSQFRELQEFKLIDSIDAYAKAAADAAAFLGVKLGD